MVKKYFSLSIFKLLLFSITFQFYIPLTYQTIISQNTIFNGDATTYGGSVYGGSCGFKKIWSNPQQNSIIQFNYGLAINSKQYNNSLSCGQCINIQYNNHNKQTTSINTIVTDICPECKFGDLDLFTETYKTLINEDPGRTPITWSFIECPENIVSNNLQLRIDEINYYWLSIQPENFKCGISNIFIFQHNQWIEMNRDDSKMVGLFFIYNKKIEIPFKFKIINIYFEEIITDLYYEIKNLFILNNQFLCNKKQKLTEISVYHNSEIICDS